MVVSTVNVLIPLTYPPDPSGTPVTTNKYLRRGGLRAGARAASARAQIIAKISASRQTRADINARARRHSESWRVIGFSLDPKKWRAPDAKCRAASRAAAAVEASAPAKCCITAFVIRQASWMLRVAKDNASGSRRFRCPLRHLHSDSTSLYAAGSGCQSPAGTPAPCGCPHDDERL